VKYKRSRIALGHWSPPQEVGNIAALTVRL
jgi:hypothetical protein